MKYIIHKKKDVKECDGMVSGDFGIPVYPDADAPIGMGHVNPRGGPDRWDMGLEFDSSRTRKSYKIKKRK